MECSPGKNRVVLQVIRGGGCDESPTVVPVSASHVAEGLVGYQATSAETFADARCDVEVTLEVSDDDGVVPVRYLGARRWNS